MALPLIPLYSVAMKVSLRTTTLLLLLAMLLAGSLALWPRQSSTLPQHLPQVPAQGNTTLQGEEEPAAHEPLPAISPGLAAAIRQHSRHSSAELKQTVNPDGSVSLEHGEHYQSVMVATRDANGNLVIRHGEDFLPHANSAPAP